MKKYEYVDSTNGDYSEPLAVYEVLFPEDNYQTLLGNTDTSVTVSEELERIMEKKVNASVITQINAYGSSENLAASTICTAGINQSYRGKYFTVV